MRNVQDPGLVRDPLSSSPIPPDGFGLVCLFTFFLESKRGVHDQLEGEPVQKNLR